MPSRELGIITERRRRQHELHAICLILILMFGSVAIDWNETVIKIKPD